MPQGNSALPDDSRTLLRTVPLLDSEEGRAIVRRVCEARKFPAERFLDLVEAEVKQIGKDRRRGMTEDFEEIFDKMNGDVD